MNALVSLVVLLAVAPPTDDAIQRRVETRAAAIASALSKGRAAVEASVGAAIDDLLDLPRFGKGCLPQSWTTLTAPEQARFLTAFRQMLIRQFCRPLLDDSDVRISVLGHTRVGAELRVRMRIEGRRNSREVEWAFPDGAGGRAGDSIVDDTRQSSTYSRSLERSFRRGGLDAVIAKMTR